MADSDSNLFRLKMDMNARAKAGRNRRAPVRHVANERGSVLALVVLLLIVLLGLSALAIDLGMLHVARGEAQRAADAAAHGGAAYFFRNQGATEAEIKQEAIRVGQSNLIRGAEGDITENDVEILWDEDKVRAHVFRTQGRQNPVRTLFARVLGFASANISASAAAELWPADASECVWPFALPDKWCLNNGVPCTGAEYSDGLASGQGWESDHRYISWRYPVEINGSEKYWTGYSDEDYGRPLIIKPQSPQGSIQPGWFFPFRIPGNQGADDYRAAIRGCETGNRVWGVDSTLYTEPGNMVGPTQQGFQSLLNDFPDADWDTDCGCPVGNPEHIAGRTRPVVLFDPSNPPAQGNMPFTVEGFAAVFFAGFDASGDVLAYFVELLGNKPAASRNDSGANPQLKILRIVE